MAIIDIHELSKQLLDNLTSNILPYWIDKMVDNEHGGFYGQRDGYDNLVSNTPKGAILNARLLWTFSAAYRLTHEPQYLEMATRAKQYIIDNFYDKEFGGIYWSLNADGSPLDTKKQFYAIGFAIYGLSEYVRATGDTEALDYAIRLFHDIELHSHDRERGGYIEACTRQWGEIADMRLSDKEENCAKTMNTHLHIIEPYTNLYRVWKDPELHDAIEHLLYVFFDIMEDKSNHHLGLFFDMDWNRQDDEQSFGHDIEASWLLLESAMVLDDKAITDKALSHTYHIAKAALEGRCHDGSMIYERHANGSYNNDKHWWVQAECMIGEIYLYKHHNKQQYLAQAIETWQYIQQNIVDHSGGEWYWSRLADGSVNRTDDKAGFWKCPYHNSRMCIEIIETLGK